MIEHYQIESGQSPGVLRWPSLPGRYGLTGETDFQPSLRAAPYEFGLRGTLTTSDLEVEGAVACLVHTLSADRDPKALVLEDSMTTQDPIEQEFQRLHGQVYRGRELEWRRTHPEILRDLVGQWVVLEGETIIVSGNDPVRLVEEARTRGVQVPFVFRVEPEDEDVIEFGL